MKYYSDAFNLHTCLESRKAESKLTFYYVMFLQNKIIDLHFAAVEKLIMRECDVLGGI